ncbi:family 20 glycosylhydrolase [Erysipelothrix amsterdamensis]|uniref:Family 20 glycosylhydrolase n=1 Tax=Erysipelothrix amsterdamensis TaxID=2929157 RepID=A0AAU9VH90_9FIRM|nr:family 20 glycosylhydrolase [Erysipelothrix sp. A18Y020d]CAH2761140.1 family 20 glycosylhydrolase [Erysipelothrix sp. A18Y020d]
MESNLERTIIPEVKQYQLHDGVVKLKPKIFIETERLISKAIYKRIRENHKKIVYEPEEDVTSIHILPMEEVHPRGSYIITIDDTIKIYANDEEGTLYAVQTLLKYELTYGAIQKGEIIDEPSVEERGFHLDCGRKYFTPQWIHQLLDTLAWHNFNMLQLHFSENKGFRLECTQYPEIVSQKALSLQELKEIMELADEYCIEIVPSFDSPGHLKHVLKTYPEYALPGSDGEAWDITNPKALEMIYELYDYYAEVFQKSRYFNIGGDEFIDFEQFDAFPELKTYAQNHLEGETGYDTYLDYLNTIASRLETKGFTVRLWNDGLYRLNQNPKIALKPSIQVCYWTKYNRYMAPISEFENKDIALINFHAENFYYVLHPEVGVKCIDPESWFETWTPNHFPSNQLTDKVEGAYYSLWCDEPELQTEDEILKQIHMPLCAMSAKAWRKESTMTYQTLVQKEQIRWTQMD